MEKSHQATDRTDHPLANGHFVCFMELRNGDLHSYSLEVQRGKLIFKSKTTGSVKLELDA